jgi:hypothetical protein
MVYEKLSVYYPVQTCIKKRKNGDFLIVMNDKEDIFYLNDVAQFVYEHCTGDMSIEGIRQMIFSEYEHETTDDGAITEDLVNIIRDFQWQNIIELRRLRNERV